MNFPRFIHLAKIGFIAVFGLVLVISLAWQIRMPVEGDSSFLNYFAWLIREQGYVPYRDAFDTSFPMTLLFHIGVTTFSGYSDMGYQCANVVILLMLMFLGYRIIANINKQAAWVTVITLALIYEWQDISVGREFQCLLWLLCAINILLTPALTLTRRVIFATVFLAFAASTKPHFIIGVLPLMYFLWKQENLKLHESLRLIAISATIGLTVICLPFLWAWWKGGLPAFAAIFTGYLPLYLELSGASDVVSSEERPGFLFAEWFNYVKYVFPPMVISLLLFFKKNNDPFKKQLVILLAAEAVTYSIYLLPAGKFWLFQMVPFFYFSISIIALAFIPDDKSLPATLASLGLIIILGFVNYGLSHAIITQHNTTSSDSLLEYLQKKNLRPEDTVQLWQYNTDGAHGLLQARVKTATPHMTYEPFYHHISDPYTIALRAEFIAQLQKAMPKIIIREKRLFIPRGDDTTNRFEELEQFIAMNYTLDLEEDYYLYYQRKN